jgi:hypothetical protein
MIYIMQRVYKEIHSNALLSLVCMHMCIRACVLLYVHIYLCNQCICAFLSYIRNPSLITCLFIYVSLDDSQNYSTGC